VDDRAASLQGNREKTREVMCIPENAVVLMVLGRITPSQKMDPAPLLALISGELLEKSGLPHALAWLVITWMIKYNLLRMFPGQDAGENQTESSRRIRISRAEEACRLVLFNKSAAFWAGYKPQSRKSTTALQLPEIFVHSRICSLVPHN
jgi:hypothetical protein